MSAAKSKLETVLDGLGIEAKSVPNPAPAPWGNAQLADGWTVTLTYIHHGYTITVPFWRGTAYREWVVLGGTGLPASVKATGVFSNDYVPSKGWYAPQSPKELPFGLQPTIYNLAHARYRPIPPNAADVISCLMADAQSVESAGSFEAWCSDCGLDTDSRRAEKSYRDCLEIAVKLRGFLGLHWEEVAEAAAEY